MTATMFFWLCMILWLILGAGPAVKSGPKGLGVALLPWVCVAIVGWSVLGPIIS